MKNTIIAAVFVLSGCGTVFSGTVQKISFDSNIPGVEVYVDTIYACTTPCVHPVARSSRGTSIAGKIDGYEPRYMEIRGQFNYIALGNFTFWPLWLTDILAEGMWRYNRDSIYLNMKPRNLTAEAEERFKKESAIRNFILNNFNTLQSGDAEALTSLAALTGLAGPDLLAAVQQSRTEVSAVDKVMGLYYK